jgi:cysteine desulfurase
VRQVKRIYLDHAATTPLAPEAKNAMVPWLDSGNPSSLYEQGRKAKAAIDTAREIVSDALGCLFAELLFTSGGTESANLAIVGAALGRKDRNRNRILLGAAEHHCVLHTQGILEQLGFIVELVPVDCQGVINLQALDRAIGEDIFLVSIQHANNELGTINPIPIISEMVHRVGAIVHTDAVQSFMKLPGWRVEDLGADLVSVSAHKVNGPKAVGALYVRAGTKIKSLVGGGGQEREVRGGTENVAGIVGFGAAVQGHLSKKSEDLTPAIERFIGSLEAIGAVRSVPEISPLKIVHVRFPGRSAETLLIALDRAGVSASSGAACSSGSIEPSHVLKACGYSDAECREGLRFSIGQGTSEADLVEASERIAKVVRQGRSV